MMGSTRNIFDFNITNTPHIRHAENNLGLSYLGTLNSEQTAYRFCPSATIETASAFVFPTDVGKQRPAPYRSLTISDFPVLGPFFFICLCLQLQVLNIQPSKKARPIICDIENGISRNFQGAPARHLLSSLLTGSGGGASREVRRFGGHSLPV